MPADRPTIPSRGSLALQAVSHGAAFALLVIAASFLHDREQAGSAGVSLYLAGSLAFLIGLALSHILHEWGHFLGAVLGGARLTTRRRIAPLFFDFDFPLNTPRQFLLMSLGGLSGNLLLLLFLSLCIETPGLVLTAMRAAVLGQLVFVVILELPVSLRVLAGQAPLAALTEHFSQGAPLFLRSLLAGTAVAALVILSA
jgi:hypothetical protein